ncbi:MAG TPA: tetratricopeptide repeat protein, partial [Sunxiuqinia sp.]|nr:tetratricopeptide repeat protein [Sunxiuqinia sp.]
MILKRFTYLLLLSTLLASCATTKKALVKTDNKQEEQLQKTSAPAETKLSENQENEFEYLFIEGLKQKMLGNVKDAVTIFSRCLEIDPNSSVAMFEMAKIHYANKDLTSASLLLEKAISLNPNNKWYKLLLADIYQQRKQFDEAANLYVELSNQFPDNLKYQYSEAVLFAQAKKYSEAIATYNHLEDEVGLNEQISVAKQQIFMDWGKPDKAFEEVHKLMDSDPKNPEYYGLLAELYEKQGDKENALKYYNKILELDPGNGIVHFSLANYYLDQDNKAKAFDEVKKAFANKNVDADTKIRYYMMQTTNPDSSDWSNDQINDLLDILHNTYPDDNRMYTIYADHLMRQKKTSEAREYLRKYLETDKNNFTIWQQLLFMDNDLMDFESLYKESKQAIDLFPNQPVVYALNAVAAIQLKKYKEALEVVKEGEPYALDNQSLKVQFMLYKAEAYYNLKEVDKAFKAYDEVIKLAPDNYMAMNNYAYYLSLRGQDLEKAEHMSGKVIQANPDNPTY